MEELTPVECRVLGALIEKSLATPQHYPLSEQALLSACNQTSNREPITDYGVADVRRGLIGLRRAGLAREVHQPGARVEKHRHTVDEALGLGQDELGVLGLLLLRGPQTPGELRSRATRLHEFASVASVVDVLDALADRDAPLVRRLERRPGQKESRYVHLLGEGDLADAPTGGSAEGWGPAGPAPPADPEDEPAAPHVAKLRNEVAELRRRVAALERRLGDVADEPPAG